MSAEGKGFPDLVCIKCNESNTVLLDLEDLTRFWCSNCEDEFHIGEVKAVLEGWRPVINWLEGRDM